MNNPFSHLDGMQAMSDPLGFIKKLWGGLNVPGVVTPPMSVEELDKKIQDLKTVESWLNVNMNMLRATIQGLEVQRATITTLQNLGESFAEHARKAGGTAEQMASSFAQSRAASTAWPMPDNPAEATRTSTEQTAEAATADKSAPETATVQAADPQGTGNFTNPAAWWGMMQDQFKAAVGKTLQAMPQATPTAAATAATPATPASPQSTTRTSTSSASKSKITSAAAKPAPSRVKKAAKPSDTSKAVKPAAKSRTKKVPQG